MAHIYITGVSKAITVSDAPSFEEACAMISELDGETLIVFPTPTEDIAVIKKSLIMFVQGKKSAKAPQYVVPTKEAEEAVITRKPRKKRARSKSVQS